MLDFFKKRRPLFLLLGVFFLVRFSLSAQLPLATPVTLPKTADQLKVFINDSITGHHATNVYFETAYKYCLPHVCVNRLGKCALIGFDHQPITGFEYDVMIGDWLENAYIVRRNNLKGCIDTTGKFIVPVSYPQLYISQMGKLITTGSKEKSFVKTRRGEPILPIGYSYLGELELSDRIVVKARREMDRFVTFFDLNGKKLKNTCPGFDIERSSALSFNRYTVKVSADTMTNIRIVDSNFHMVVPPIFQRISWTNEKWAFGEVSGSHESRLFAIHEQKIYPLPYQKVNAMDDYAFLIAEQDSKFGILDEHLQVIIKPEFSSIEYIQGKELFAVRTFSGKAGLVDVQGFFVLDTVYLSIWPNRVYKPFPRKNIGPPLLKEESTVFLSILDFNGTEKTYRIDENIFLEDKILVLTPDLYMRRTTDGLNRLMHRDGREMSLSENYVVTSDLKVVVQKSNNSTAQVYDPSGLRLKELTSLPRNMDLPRKEYYTWIGESGLMGILDSNLDIVVNDQYESIFQLTDIPLDYVDIWEKYVFRHPDHPFLAWVWDNDNKNPLLIKNNGELVKLGLIR